MYQMSHPGAKLNFMGNEFAPYLEWRYYEELEWFMLQYPRHREMHDFVRVLNHLYLSRPAFWEIERSWEGFRWLVVDDRENSIFSYARFGKDEEEIMVVILNMTPVSFRTYRVPVPKKGRYKLVLNSDASCFGGSDFGGPDLQGTSFMTADLSLDHKRMEYGEAADQDGYSEDSSSGMSWIELPIAPLAGMYLLFDGDSFQ